MMAVKLRYSPRAKQDALEIREYISETLKNPEAAQRLMQRITDACGRLKEFPQAGAQLYAGGAPAGDVRFIMCRRYRIIYEVGKETVDILRILYDRRDYEPMFLTTHNIHEDAVKYDEFDLTNIST